MKRLGLTFGLLGLAFSVAGGCSGSSMPSSPAPQPGEERQPCKADKTCNPGLSCYSDVCVLVPGGGTGGTDATGSGGTDSTGSGGTDATGSGGTEPSGEAGGDGTGATGAGGDTDPGVGGGGGSSGEFDCRTEESYVICANAGLDWEDAQAYCVSKGGALVKLDNADENSDVAELINQEGSTWIGANDRDTEGEFRWTDGSQVTGDNAHWQGGQPNDAEEKEDCAVLHAAGDWNDVDCSLTGFDDGHDMTFVCELPN